MRHADLNEQVPNLLLRASRYERHTSVQDERRQHGNGFHRNTPLVVPHHLLWPSDSVRMGPRLPILLPDDPWHPKRNSQLQRLSLGSGGNLHYLGAHLLDDNWTYRLRHRCRDLVRPSSAAQRVPCPHNLPDHKHRLAGVGAVLHEPHCLER